MLPSGQRIGEQLAEGFSLSPVDREAYPLGPAYVRVPKAIRQSDTESRILVIWLLPVILEIRPYLIFFSR